LARLANGGDRDRFRALLRRHRAAHHGTLELWSPSPPRKSATTVAAPNNPARSSTSWVCCVRSAARPPRPAADRGVRAGTAVGTPQPGGRSAFSRRTRPRWRMTSESPFARGCAWIEDEYVPIAEARIPILDTGFTRSDLTYDV